MKTDRRTPNSLKRRAQGSKADVLTKEQRSFCMSQIRSQDTKAELVLRKAAFALGLRYRLRSTLPGRPDLVFPGARLVVFVDGCFWHRCPEHAIAPVTNATFWASKIDRNVQRDREVTEVLEAAGWMVLRFWEHELKSDPGEVARRLLAIVRTRRR